MAKAAARRHHNVPGTYYVDATCIDCATCRWLAPAVFDRAAGQSRVYRQPATPEAELRARMAVLACPVAAIGGPAGADYAPARAAFPERITDGVYHCGYHARSSFGAASYLIVRAGGNVLVDSPRYAGPLVRAIERLGGVRYILLTHRDDVADHARYAAALRAERILHSADRTRDTWDVERLVAGEAPVALAKDLLLIPTPGHSPGSICLLYDGRVLLSGDHLAWDSARGALTAHPAYASDWTRQRASVARLAEYAFEWLLPGHGERVHLPAPAMREALWCLHAQMG
jgi:glyoxylase-like metal-dependent hydrolase (beta-lactamase superfamily II)/ferredoxin